MVLPSGREGIFAVCILIPNLIVGTMNNHLAKRLLLGLHSSCGYCLGLSFVCARWPLSACLNYVPVTVGAFCDVVACPLRHGLNPICALGLDL